MKTRPTLLRSLLLIPELGKARIAVPVSLSALTGYLAARSGWGPEAWYLAAGVFILALGASALNQVQEYRFDLRMERTRHRPIPSGRLTPARALLFSALLILTGGAILWLGCGDLSLGLGVLTIIVYNLMYTYLKRVTAFAVVPGAVVGALPPLIGWSATGNPVMRDPALALAAFFFIGQIPHFWLIILSIGKQYEEAGYPSLSSVLSRPQIGRLTLAWIIATAAAALLLPMSGTLDEPILSGVLAAGAAWLVIRFILMARHSVEDIHPRKGFVVLNLFFLLVMALVWVNAALGG